MIVLNKQNSDEEIIVTLEESRTINDAYYLFVFTNVTTKDLIKLIYSTNDD